MDESGAHVATGWRRRLWLVPMILVAGALAMVWLSGREEWLGAIGVSNDDVLVGTPVLVSAALSYMAVLLSLAMRDDLVGRGLRKLRFHWGVRRLGGRRLATRVRGVAALERLALDHPDECHLPVMNELCEFIMFPPVRGEAAADARSHGLWDKRSLELPCPPDVEAAARAVGGCRARLVNGDRRRVEGRHLPELVDADLSGTNLAGGSFRGARLRLAEFKLSNLSGADFSSADLTRADFSRSVLRFANLEWAKLRKVRFGNVDATGASLVKAELMKTTFTHANFQGADFTKADCYNAFMAHANFTGANFTDANLRGATLSGSSFRDAVGLTQEMLETAAPSNFPKSLPEGLVWPFEPDVGMKWKLKRDRATSGG